MQRLYSTTRLISLVSFPSSSITIHKRGTHTLCLFFRLILAAGLSFQSSFLSCPCNGYLSSCSICLWCCLLAKICDKSPNKFGFVSFWKCFVCIYYCFFQYLLWWIRGYPPGLYCSCGGSFRTVIRLYMLACVSFCRLLPDWESVFEFALHLFFLLLRALLESSSDTSEMKFFIFVNSAFWFFFLEIRRCFRRLWHFAVYLILSISTVFLISIIYLRVFFT